MRRYFNTEGRCDPQEHYMVRLDERLDKIRRLFVDRGRYFMIDRGRQYGKTTTLNGLAGYLKDDYVVLSVDFQEIGTEEFKNEAVFSYAFAEILIRAYHNMYRDGKTEEDACIPLLRLTENKEAVSLRELFIRMSFMCENMSKPVVLMIDEVDSASNNQVFLDFLALLRAYYLDRKNKATFHSVILAGVYDIKNLKLKIRPEEEHKYNSPWNIAARFNVDMSFSPGQISAMLQEYEEDNRTGMDVYAIGTCIYAYTSGYPYLVSLICQYLDEEIPGSKGFADRSDVWTEEGVEEAVKRMLSERTPLFDSMMKQLDIHKDLRDMISDILYQGRKIPYSPLVHSVELGMMLGYLKQKDGYITVANRIFEMGLLDKFITEEASQSEAFRYGQQDREQFIKGTRLDMELVLERFVECFTDLYGDNDERFVEAYGRKLFLLYLKPIINGVGNYYIEAQTRDAKRTDVIVDYLGERSIIELKIWRGNEYNERGEQQLSAYLDYFHQKKGYLVSFNFNKKKVAGIKKIQIGDKMIVEAVV